MCQGGKGYNDYCGEKIRKQYANRPYLKVLGRHSVLYSLELPNWLPKAVVEEILNHYRALLKEVLHDISLLEPQVASKPHCSSIHTIESDLEDQPRCSSDTQSSNSTMDSGSFISGLDHIGVMPSENAPDNEEAKNIKEKRKLWRWRF
jgi:hypothetical protein